MVITPHLGHLSILNLGHSLILLLLFLYQSNVPVLAELQSCVVFVSYCIWVEIPIHQQNYVLSTQPPSFLHKYRQYIGVDGGN
jgi:hypothetical protein